MQIIDTWVVAQVNLKLFAPDPNKARTILLFVFRDRTKTPLPRLIQTWEEDLAQMWDSIPKPTQYEGNAFTDFFEVGPPFGIRPYFTVMDCS